MKKQEAELIQAYLRRLFGQDGIEVRTRAKKDDDTAEVYIRDEFIGTLAPDEDDDPEDPEATYQFRMAILASDL